MFERPKFYIQSKKFDITKFNPKIAVFFHLNLEVSNSPTQSTVFFIIENLLKVSFSAWYKGKAYIICKASKWIIPSGNSFKKPKAFIKERINFSSCLYFKFLFLYNLFYDCPEFNDTAACFHLCWPEPSSLSWLLHRLLSFYFFVLQIMTLHKPHPILINCSSA